MNLSWFLVWQPQNGLVGLLMKVDLPYPPSDAIEPFTRGVMG